MIKAILFDIDGVLLDSRKANHKFYQDLLSLAGYKRPSEKETSRVFHLTLIEGLPILTGEKSKEKIKEIWQLRWQINYPSDLLKTVPGEAETIKKLSKDYKLAVVSGRVRKGIEIFYEFTGLKKYFSADVSFEDYTHPKPDPEPLLVALKKIKEKPEDTIYVGDSLTDFQAAQALGMKFIGFYGVSKKKFKEAQANIKDFTELPKTIEKL